VLSLVLLSSEYPEVSRRTAIREFSSIVVGFS
jgi:hypothetical protein